MTNPLEAAQGGRRVWTLLDIMRQFSTADFIDLYTAALTYTLRHMQGFSRLTTFLSRFTREGPVPHSAQLFTEDERAALGSWLSDSERECAELELLASAATLRKMRHAVERDRSRHGDLWQLGRELADRLADEMEGRFFLSLDAREADSYTAPLQGWERVTAAFPGATSDMEEAVRCFALGRYTASVFHLMRVMEIGVQATRRCLSIAEPSKSGERNWGAILKNIKSEMDRRRGGGWANTDDSTFFDQVYVSLDAVKNAWRNATMHVESKYTEEEAEHVLGAARIFMKKLADRMDEQGLPCA